MRSSLRRAFLVSILAHLAVLLPLRNALILQEKSTHAVPHAIEALLVATTREEPRTLPFENSSPPAERPERHARDMLAKSGAAEKSAVFRSPTRSTATDDVAVTERVAVASGMISHAVSPAAVHADDISVDGVRQYRLNLAREARRFKDYPPGAWKRGWEVVVVVVVNTVDGVGVPVVSLSQSSGYDVLDQAALDLVGHSVGTATMPESLRGRQFALTLPIHYRLDE